MASVTITGGAQFPEGTSVGAYPRSAWPVEGLSGAPSGSATATASISSGSATLSGLADSTDYVAYAQVGGVDRYRHFTTRTGPQPADTGTVTVSRTGDLAAVAGSARLEFPAAKRVSAIRAALGSGPQRYPVILDVNKNGASIFASQADRPTIAAGATSAGAVTVPVTDFAAGDVLTVDVDQAGARGQITYVADTVVSVTAQTTINATRPTGTQTNDVLVGIMRIFGSAAITPPAGWTEIGTGVAQGTSTLRMFWKRDDGSAGPFAFTWTGALDAAVRVFAYRGCLLSGSPVAASATASDALNQTTHAAPVVTTTTDNQMVVTGAFLVTTSATVTPPAGSTARTSGASTSHVWEAERQLAGVYTPGNVTLGATGFAPMMSVALSPEPIIGGRGSDLVVALA